MALKLQGSELVPFLTVFNSEVGYGMSSALIAGQKHPNMPAVAAISDVRSDAGKAIQGIDKLLQRLPLPAAPVWDIDGAPLGHPGYKPAYQDCSDPREGSRRPPTLSEPCSLNPASTKSKNQNEACYGQRQIGRRSRR